MEPLIFANRTLITGSELYKNEDISSVFASAPARRSVLTSLPVRKISGSAMSFLQISVQLAEISGSLFSFRANPVLCGPSFFASAVLTFNRAPVLWQNTQEWRKDIIMADIQRNARRSGRAS